MVSPSNAIARNEDRHSHIGIRLQYRVGAHWERLEAMGWNAAGFNFHHAHDIRETVLEFKRGVTRFEGTLVWKSSHASDEAMRTMILNALIFERAREVHDNPALHARLLKLIRVSGMAMEKRQILASLGQDLSDEHMAELVAVRRQQNPMFHYGVKVHAPAWTAIVDNVLSISSVVTSMERWTQAFAKK